MTPTLLFLTGATFFGLTLFSAQARSPVCPRLRPYVAGAAPLCATHLAPGDRPRYVRLRATNDHCPLTVPLSAQVSPLVVALGTTPLMLAVIVGAAQNIMSKAAKYSLFDPCKEMAYIPLDQEQKSKGKVQLVVGVGGYHGVA